MAEKKDIGYEIVIKTNSEKSLLNGKKKIIIEGKWSKEELLTVLGKL